jgi:hypothetical protein
VTSFARVRTTLAFLALACLLAGALGLGPCRGVEQGCCAGAATSGDGCCDEVPGPDGDPDCVKHACCFGGATALPGSPVALTEPLPRSTRVAVRAFAPPAEPDGRDILHVPRMDSAPVA